MLAKFCPCLQNFMQAMFVKIRHQLAHHLLLRFCTKVECFHGKEVISPNMHIHAHLREVYLDYELSQEFWLFSFERYNGILGKQPTNNKNIEPQLMQRFLRDNFAFSLPCPQEFKEDLDFANFEGPDPIIGSVQETLLPTNVQVDKIILPTKCKRTVINGTTQEILKNLYCKMNPDTHVDKVMLNSVITKYSSLCYKGINFSTSNRNNIPFIGQAEWNESWFGSPPTLLLDSYLPTTNIRPVDIKYYFQATFTTDTALSLTFAYVLWLLPHPHRYAIGKPAEL